MVLTTASIVSNHKRILNSTSYYQTLLLIPTKIIIASIRSHHRSTTDYTQLHYTDRCPTKPPPGPVYSKAKQGQITQHYLLLQDITVNKSHNNGYRAKSISSTTNPSNPSSSLALEQTFGRDQDTTLQPNQNATLLDSTT